MNKTNILSRTLLAAVIGAAAFGAQATEQPGFYAGVGAGQSIVDEGILDDEDTAFSVFGGYQVNRYFGVEAGYADFGKIEPRGVAGNVEADTAYLTAVGTLPFTESFSGYAKAGVHVWDAEARIPGVIGASDDGTDPTYGLGLQYRFTDAVALRGEYSRFEMDDIDVDLAQVQLRFDF
ncbi:outer membrane beta-barrel protein [Lysobacter sp. A286]